MAPGLQEEEYHLHIQKHRFGDTRKTLPLCGLGFRVEDLGIRVKALGIRVKDLGFRVQDLGFRSDNYFKSSFPKIGMPLRNLS